MKEALKSCDILITNATYLDEDLCVCHAPGIAIKDGVITQIGACEGVQAGERMDGEGLLWMPGLVDGHTHTSQQLLRGRLLDEKPVIWKRINVPFEAELTEETSELSAGVAALEMIRSGTTGFLDAGGKYVPAFAKVYAQSGLRGRLSYMTNDNPGMPAALRVEGEEALARQIELHQMLGGGLLRATFSVTALTAASEGLIRSMFSYAKEHNIPAEVHMNEYASEVYDFIGRYGLRPLEWLEREGLLSDNFTSAHCIFLSQSEIDVILEHNVHVVHCPFSNCGKGIPPTPQLLARGALVGFGSDGSAHGGLDLFKEMRLFRGVMNAHYGVQTGDPQVMTAKMLLKMATAGSASLMDEPGLGVLKVGAPADMIALDMDAPHLYPTQNMVNTVVESACGNDVVHTVVNGRLLMKNREVLTLDTEKIMAQARRWKTANPMPYTHSSQNQ